uniref:AAA domain-containing protein n=1 Tax=Ascaris lumbricoides TaxID=6252 RepID=A0A0M3I7J1_ASCLU
MEDACEKAFLLADQALAAEANSPRPSVETLEQEILPLLRQLKDSRYPYAICWETAERRGYLDTTIAMVEMAARIMRTKRGEESFANIMSVTVEIKKIVATGILGDSRASVDRGLRLWQGVSGQRAPAIAGRASFEALRVRSASGSGGEQNSTTIGQKIDDTNHNRPGTQRTSSHDSISGTIKRKENELDPFREGRKLAIERTIVSDTSLLPKLEDLVGLAEAKQALREALLDPLTYPEWFSSSDLKPWRCVLLYGPPGTGYPVSSSDLISTWSGQSEKLIRELFDDALSFAGTSVVFVDEIDSLCRIRSTAEDESSRRVKTELLVQLQRLHDSKSSILLICATNCPWDLDSAFLRRFEKRIFVGLPELDSRLQLLQKFLSKTKTASDVNWDEIAESTEGFSGDDLKRLAREVAFLQFRRYKESHAASQSDSGCVTVSQAERTPVSAADFHEVLQSFSPSVSPISLQRYDDYKSS